MKPAPIIFEPMGGEEIAHLTELTLRSKRYWDYPHDILTKWGEAFTAPPDEAFTERRVVGARAANFGPVVGYYALSSNNFGTNEVELTHLFVDPGMISMGYGRKLFDEAVRHAHQLGGHTLRVVCDAKAEPFYRHIQPSVERVRDVSNPIPSYATFMLRFVIDVKPPNS